MDFNDIHRLELTLKFGQGIVIDLFQLLSVFIKQLKSLSAHAVNLRQQSIHDLFRRLRQRTLLE